MGPLESHRIAVNLEIRDGRHALMPACDSEDRREASVAVSFESDVMFIATGLQGLKGLGPRGSEH